MKADGPQLGQVATGEGLRDAVHVAVIAVTARRRMLPGEKLKSGVVDPFLDRPVEAGERFWLLLYPGQVTGVRHVWSADTFPEELPEEVPVRRSERDVWTDELWKKKQQETLS